MDLFANILSNLSPATTSTNKFLGKTQEPSFMQSLQVPKLQSQAPKTTGYTKPQTSSFIPQANAGQPLISDDEIKQMIDAGASDDEIGIMVGELEKERGSKQVPQAPQVQAPEKPFLQKAGGFLTGVGQNAMNVTGGAVNEGVNILGNTAGFLNKMGGAMRGQIPEQIQGSSDFIKGVTQKSSDFIKKNGNYDPESIGASLGKLGADVLSTVIGPGKIFKTAEGANMAIKGLASIANTSIEGTTAAVTNYVTQEGRLPTEKEVAEFIAVQGGVKTLGNIAGQVKKLPSARLIPTTITEAGRDIRKGIDIGEAISKTGISFTKGQLIKKVEKISSNLSKNVDSAIQKVIDKTGPNSLTIGNLTKDLKTQIMSDSTIKAQLKGTPIQMPQIEEAINETIKAYKKLYGAKKFDLNAQQQLKKDIYGGLENVFNKNFQTTGKITAQQATERQIARKLKENIEVKVPEVVSLNKQLAPFLEAGKRLNAKGGYSGYLTDILAGGFAGGSPGGIISDPVGYAKNFLLGVVAKRVGTSTLAKTSASTITANIEKVFKNPTFQKAILDQYRQLNSNQ